MQAGIRPAKRNGCRRIGVRTRLRTRGGLMATKKTQLDDLQDDYWELLDQHEDNNAFSKTLLELVKTRITELENLIEKEG